MEDYKIDIMIESGPNARTVQITLNPFTLVGATTRSGLLTAPMRARFGISSRLQYYSTELLSTIIERSAEILNVPIDNNAAIGKWGEAVEPHVLPMDYFAVFATLLKSKANRRIDLNAFVDFQMPYRSTLMD